VNVDLGLAYLRQQWHWSPESLEKNIKNVATDLNADHLAGGVSEAGNETGCERGSDGEGTPLITYELPPNSTRAEQQSLAGHKSLPVDSSPQTGETNRL
jgi:hypothetical protein